jgi:putative alpha-1,2-mannosidase
MRIKSIRIWVLLIVGNFFLPEFSGLAYGQDPVDYVNPTIGSIGHLLTATTPDVQLPHGMIRVIPTTTPGIRDVYLADKIYSFSTVSLSNDFSRGVGAFSIMATTGKIKTNPDENASWFDHDLEKTTPYCCSARGL